MLDKIVSKYRKIEVINPDAYSEEEFIKPDFFQNFGPLRSVGAPLNKIFKELE